MNLNEKIRKLRTEKKWSQAELAEKLDITPGHITRLETGKFTPSTEVVRKLSRIFDVSADFLLDDSIDNEYDQNVINSPLMKRIQLISSLDKQQQEAIMTIIDSMIKEKKMRDILNQSSVN
jgi:transcriptional regulator with XRE-family HTH domain